MLPHVDTNHIPAFKTRKQKAVGLNFLLSLPTTVSSECRRQYREFCHLFIFFIIFSALWHHWQHTVNGQYKKKNCLENTYLGRSWFEWFLKNTRSICEQLRHLNWNLGPFQWIEAPALSNYLYKHSVTSNRTTATEHIPWLTTKLIKSWHLVRGRSLHLDHIPQNLHIYSSQ